jgi:hypothetical protein
LSDRYSQTLLRLPMYMDIDDTVTLKIVNTFEGFTSLKSADLNTEES